MSQASREFLAIRELEPFGQWQIERYGNMLNPQGQEEAEEGKQAAEFACQWAANQAEQQLIQHERFF